MIEQHSRSMPSGPSQITRRSTSIVGAQPNKKWLAEQASWRFDGNNE